MIIIGPGTLILLALLLFKPLRVLVGWTLLIILCAGIYGCQQGAGL